MGSSQSSNRPNESKRYSRVGDQIKSVLRRPGPATPENNGEDVKPQSTSIANNQVVTNGNHNKTPTSETETKKADHIAVV